MPMPDPQKQNPAGGRGSAAKHATGQAQANGNAAAVQTSTNTLCLSVITAADPRRLAKRFDLVDGKLRKQPGGSLVRGRYERRTVRSVDELATLVAGLGHDQALTYGVASAAECPIASRGVAGSDDITRTREHFDWPSGPGVMFLDYDPAPRTQPIEQSTLLSMLIEVCPALAMAPTLQGASGSTYIYDDAGVELRGAGGLRVWVAVADARDIPRAGKALFERLWLAGHGYYAVSDSGALLPRSLVDAAVWQPERLDFASGASVGPGLVQRRPALIVRNADALPLDTSKAMVDLTHDDRQLLAQMQATAKDAVAPTQTAARERWLDARMNAWEKREAPRLATLATTERDVARDGQRARYARAVTELRLFGDFDLIHSSGRTVNVGIILDDPAKWHNERFADPLEPTYGNDKRIAVANLRSGGKPTIWSHAHGGQRFTLERASSVMQVARGDGPRMVDEADALLRLAGEVYQRGGTLARVAGDGVLPVTGPWLRNHLESICRFEEFDGRSKKSKPTDCPGELHTRILHNRGAWTLPELVGIVRAPILRTDGSLLDMPGYDQASGLLLLSDGADAWPAIPRHPTPAMIRAAIRILWEPFEHFPFLTPVDRAVHLSACLTAVQRPMLETAPAFAWNAYKAGTGKGKAAAATAWLSGSAVSVSPWSTESEEQRKRLMTALLAGPGALLLDNINGQFESDTLCAILTSTHYSDRILGLSEGATVPTRVLVLATGNNIRIVGDLVRRVLTCTIDHGVESPESLTFPFCPVARAQERWQHYRAAALTILRGFVAAGSPRIGRSSVGSFEQWDRTIRQCVLWVDRERLAPFELGDPVEVIKRNQDEDPETMKLRALVDLIGEIELRTCAQGVGVAVSTLINSAVGDERTVLDEIAGERGVVNPRRLGRWIEGHQGRVLDSRRIVRAGTRKNVAVWTVKAA